jgi:hypothetical protein
MLTMAEKQKYFVKIQQRLLLDAPLAQLVEQTALNR